MAGCGRLLRLVWGSAASAGGAQEHLGHPYSPVPTCTSTHPHTLLPQEQGRQQPDDRATGFTVPQRRKVVSSASLVTASCAGSQVGCAAERGRLHGADGTVHDRQCTHSAPGTPPLSLNVGALRRSMIGRWAAGSHWTRLNLFGCCVFLFFLYSHWNEITSNVLNCLSKKGQQKSGKNWVRRNSCSVCRWVTSLKGVFTSFAEASGNWVKKVVQLNFFPLHYPL